ncbi:hypothetical protein [Sphingobium ummariense]|uniref:hypothetical protein n=1 Tax=Sphingobium ummariense TaxID=420994 RepID=UPI00041A918F|nr:hypothetical protein [Sphingobium ummariense]
MDTPAGGITPDPIGSTGFFLPAYRPGKGASCPQCGARQWLVGRTVAECACCATALPLDAGYRRWATVTPARTRQIIL